VKTVFLATLVVTGTGLIDGTTTTVGGNRSGGGQDTATAVTASPTLVTRITVTNTTINPVIILTWGGFRARSRGSCGGRRTIGLTTNVIALTLTSGEPTRTRLAVAITSTGTRKGSRSVDGGVGGWWPTYTSITHTCTCT